MRRRHAIGVVGTGPKGTYALDCLATRLALERPDIETEVHVFEPHPDLGAGPVYSVDQPDYLRLNYANRQVDMWSRPAEGPTLVEWLELHHPDLADPDDSAPRAIVGEYLCDGFERIMSRLGRHATVHLHRSAATRIRRQRGTWTIASVGDAPVAADSVLVATGHGSRSARPSGLEGPNYVESVYPIVDSGLDRIAARSPVAVRGLGLTAIDVALALTEGRGGRFVTSNSPIPTYRPSGNEPSVIVAYSRSGITMTPKPRYVETTHAAAWAARCADLLRDAPQPFAALAALLAEGSGSSTVADARPTASVGDRGDSVSHAIHVAFGSAPPTRDSRVAATWRAAYPHIVDAVIARRFDDHWNEFTALARRMERIAFGPPALNAARFAALVEAGIVDLSMAGGPHVTRTTRGFTLDTGTATRCVDTLVNAVITPPGVGREPSPLIAGLLEDGHVRINEHGDGIEVDSETRAIARNGRPSPGLAVIGRVTDGATLGNDTLSRTLHDFPERWATTCLTDIERTEGRHVLA